jgi:hypothetical protein
MLPSFYQTNGDNGLWVFVLVTLIMGGAAAWTTGKAVAQTWRPPALLAFYGALLAFAVRFFQYALFEQPLLAVNNLAADYAVLVAIAAGGFLHARRRQMARQYPWLAASRAGSSRRP